LRVQGQAERRTPGPNPPTIPAGKGAMTVVPSGVTQRSRL
jgi:hypothetical protein